MRFVVLIAALVCGFNAVAKQYATTAYLGTSVQFTIENVSATEQDQAFELVKQELTRLDMILSRYNKSSSLSILNREKQLKNAPVELIDVLKLCQQWQVSTTNHFSCRLGSILPIWQQAEQTQTMPSRIEVRREARSLRDKTILINGSHITLDEELTLDVNGIAKGFIIDKVYDLLVARYSESRFKIDIGGDGRHYGAWPIAFTNPNVKNATQVMLTNLENHAYAASGLAFRHFQIKHNTFSHIFAPRDGWPITKPIGAAVIAKTTANADAIATALTTMNGVNAIDWLNKHDVAGVLFLPDGRVVYSKTWQQRDVSKHKAKLTFDYTLPEFDIADYRKPYVAIWLSDTKGNPIKQMAILGDSERWWQQSRRWWRKVGRKENSVFPHLAHATRKPGQHSISWFGEDDFGQIVTENELILHIEVSREHGDTSYQKLPFNLTKQATITKDGKGEIGQLSLTITP